MTGKGSSKPPSPASPSDSRDSSPGSEATTAHRSKAGIRVSLACVPCRSKHIKCDATTPTCNRCLAEQKPCYYAKSRRGIRDAKRRSMISDKQPAADPTGGLWPVTQMSALHLPIRILNDMPAGWSILPRGIVPGSSPAAATALLLDQFYVNCFPCYPWILPKPHMMSRISSSPTDLQFLIGAMTYVASLYEPTVASDDLRESVYSQACGPLPMTPQTVQALAIMSVCALGEDKPELCDGWLDRAVRMALDIGMQHKAFADAEPDPVVAESYRRTYWGLYVTDCHRAVRDVLPSFGLYAVHASAELPCEEWDYQSGSIPPPLSMAAYDSRDPVEEPAFSSWTYAVDLARLVGDIVLPLKLYQGDACLDQIRRVDMRVQNWLIRIPKWKTEAVDASGTPDMVLWTSIGIAHNIRIRIRQPYNRLKMSFREGFPVGPLDRPQLPLGPKLGGSWDVLPAEMEAVNAFCHAFHGYLAPSFFNPVSVVGTARMSMAVLDGCVFLGCDTAGTREKLSLGFALLKRAAEVWPLARRLANDLKAVAAAYLPPRPVGGAGGGGGGGGGGEGSSIDSGDGLGGLGWLENFFAVSMPEIPTSLDPTHAPFLATLGSEDFEEWLSGNPGQAYGRDI